LKVYPDNIKRYQFMLIGFMVYECLSKGV